jgi:hypothetical protein
VVERGRDCCGPESCSDREVYGWWFMNKATCTKNKEYKKGAKRLTAVIMYGDG